MSVSSRTMPALCAERIDPDKPLGVSRPKHPGDCGWDLTAMRSIVVRPGHLADVPINCRLQLPDGYWAQILARSSINVRGLCVECGVIDNGYRGDIFVMLRNVILPAYVVDPLETQVPSEGMARAYVEQGVNDVVIQEGERVGQLVLHSLMPALLSEEPVSQDTARGANGFGSTGTGLEPPEWIVEPAMAEDGQHGVDGFRVVRRRRLGERVEVADDSFSSDRDAAQAMADEMNASGR